MMKEIRVRGKRGSHALRQVGKQCRDFTQLRPSRAKLDPTGLRSNRAFSRCGPVSLAWVGGRFSPCCRFRLRKRKDFRQSDSSPDTPYPRRHLEPLQDLSRFRIDSPHIALVTFPSSVPELVVDSGDPSDDAVGREFAPFGGRFDELSAPMLPHPERSFGPTRAPMEPSFLAAGQKEGNETL